MLSNISQANLATRLRYYYIDSEFWVNLIKWASNVRPQKSFLHVGRGRWVMHDGMQYYPIQGQGHEPLKVNPFIFKSYLLCHVQWQLATEHWFLNWGTISKFVWAGFLIFVLVLVFLTLNLAETLVGKSRPSVVHGANLWNLYLSRNVRPQHWGLAHSSWIHSVYAFWRKQWWLCYKRKLSVTVKESVSS